MDTEEARYILAKELESFDNTPYEMLVERIGKLSAYEIEASNHIYQIEVEIIWDSKPDGAIRVLGSIDDGGLRAFKPLTDCILKYPLE